MGSGVPDSMWIREINTIKAERDKAIADREKISRILYEREEVGQRQIDLLLRRIEYEKAARMSEQQTTEWGLEARWVKFSERFPSDGKPVFAHMVGESEDDGHLGSIRLTGIGWFFMDFPIGEDEMVESWEWLELRPKVQSSESVVPLPDGSNMKIGNHLIVEDEKTGEERRFIIGEETTVKVETLPDGTELRVATTKTIRDKMTPWESAPTVPLPGCNQIRVLRDVEFPNLSEMFRLQAELNEHLDASMIAVADEGNERDIAQWTQNLATAMHQELAELVDCVPWKWWANYQKYDRQNARVEIVDLFHFLISLAQLHGMTAQDVFETYKAKCEINHRRHESGYKHKNPNDCKDI